MVKNRIHHILDRNHIVMSHHSDIFGIAGRCEMAQLDIPSPDNQLLKAHLEILDQIKEHIASTEKWIAKVVDNYPGIAIVGTVPGLGKIFAPLVALEIDDIKRFSSPEKLCAYAGLVPRPTLLEGRSVMGG
jgi:transposase